MKPFGLLLTGGGSRRMGSDKAALTLFGTPLACRLGNDLASVTGLALEVGPGVSDLDHLVEEPAGGGPLAAVVAGFNELTARSGEKRPVIVIGCDMPAMDRNALAWLAGYPDGPPSGASPSVVPLAAGRPQPLGARWSVADLERARAALSDGKRSLSDVFGPDVLHPGEEVWGSLLPPDVFDDVDTPDDLARLGLAPPSVGDDWVSLTYRPLDAAVAGRWVTVPYCGAVASFSGTVRDHAEERRGVAELTYESYRESALSTMLEIAAEARRKWKDLGRVATLHRLGRLEVTDTAVVVAVSAPHRGEAFAAAAWLIDTIKEAVPIWKYEKWTGDGTTPGGEGWGTCAHEIRPLHPLRDGARRP